MVYRTSVKCKHWEDSSKKKIYNNNLKLALWDVGGGSSGYAVFLKSATKIVQSISSIFCSMKLHSPANTMKCHLMSFVLQRQE